MKIGFPQRVRLRTLRDPALRPDPISGAAGQRRHREDEPPGRFRALQELPPVDCKGIVVVYNCGHPHSAEVGMWRCHQQQPGAEKDKNHTHQNPKYLAVPLPEPCGRPSCDKQVRLRAIQSLTASTVRRMQAQDYSRWEPVIGPRASS
ncbi:hypothetical protein PG996_006964 [Apiospora saccharicola]|uniref:Uncharacterized protein n=1 Tax=Apiospora saccharicola TaxID=335842 RepID=A0ABR1VAC9_9PEZI